MAVGTPLHVPQSVVGTDHIAIVPQRFARQTAERLSLRVLTPPFDTSEMVDIVQWQAYQTKIPASLGSAPCSNAAARLFDSP
ncbi:MAG TPA: hypothetical protein VGU20_29995 [Stellaceae bacterium]|nr:hypothetical protein [Stellaceae bacterium]